MTKEEMKVIAKKEPGFIADLKKDLEKMVGETFNRKKLSEIFEKYYLDIQVKFDKDEEASKVIKVMDNDTKNEIDVYCDFYTCYACLEGSTNFYIQTRTRSRVFKEHERDVFLLSKDKIEKEEEYRIRHERIYEVTIKES